MSKESITPKETKKQPTIGGQAMPGAAFAGGVFAGTPSEGIGAGQQAAFDAAADNMPF